MARVRLYIRRSDDDQSAWSAQAQERQGRDWCAMHDHEVVDIYVDDDLSGKRADRPDFERLLHDAYADPGSIVLVHKIDRLARDTELILNRHKKLRKHRVK